MGRWNMCLIVLKHRPGAPINLSANDLRQLQNDRTSDFTGNLKSWDSDRTETSELTRLFLRWPRKGEDRSCKEDCLSTDYGAQKLRSLQEHSCSYALM